MQFNADILAQFLDKVYNGFDTSSEIEPSVWREVLRVINEGTVEGLSEAPAPPAHNQLFYNALRHSNEVFSAFKVHAMGKEMAAKLLDTEGKLKPFDKWMDDVSGISSHQVGSWLRTEYNTAVIRAHTAADWKEFERNKDVMPQLRWMPTTSPNPESNHRAYWESKLTLPVDDSFWDSHHPGDRWNCKCTLEATDEPVNRPADMEETTPQRGLENNPGKDSHIFSQNHPYFPDKCRNCFAYKKNGLKDRLRIFQNRIKNCYQCPYIDGCIQRTGKPNVVPPSVETYKKIGSNNIFVSPYHGKDEMKDNVRIAKVISDMLRTEVYLLPRLDPVNPKESVLGEKLLPAGVFKNKNPDFLIDGKLYDGKSMLGLDKLADRKKQKNAIENHIKKAKVQADNIILEIPSFVDRKIIHKTINNYLCRSKKERTIMVSWKNKLLIYSK